jgi:hypothetical protein
LLAILLAGPGKAADDKADAQLTLKGHESAVDADYRVAEGY